MKLSNYKTLVASLLIMLCNSSWMQAEAIQIVTLRKNKPFAEQLNRKNTIYCIKSDFDLNGGVVTIPKGSTLKFKKGMLRNGELIGQETRVVTGKRPCFDKSLVIKGTWNVRCAYSEWFGCNPDGTDNTESLTAFFNFPAEKKILCKGEYGVNELLCDGLKNCEI